MANVDNVMSIFAYHSAKIVQLKLRIKYLICVVKRVSHFAKSKLK